MNLFKKATATVALVTLVSGVFSTGVSAYNAAELAAAEALAAAGVINNQATAADYKLDSTITRGEIAKVAANVADIAPFTTCEGKFSDVSATAPNTWVCGYVEALLAEGKVSANAEYNSERNLSKAEALKLMLEAAGHTGIYTNAATWQEEVVAYAVSNDVLAASFSDYNTSALRGWVFNVADKAMEEDEISLPDLIPGIDDEDTTDETTDETTDTTTPSVSGDNELVATLSASTPNGGNLAQGADGVDVLNFDVTAGSEDVTVSSVTLLRKGFGVDSAEKVVIYSEGARASKVRTFNSDDEAVVSFSPALVVKAGETKTLSVKVATDAAQTGEFRLAVQSIEANTEVALDDFESELFEVKGSVTAAELKFSSGSVNSQVTAGEEQADIYEFDLENSNANNEDIEVTSITIREEGNADQEEALENVTLVLNNKEIATVATVTSKYITFNFDAVVIEEGKKETFTVKADILGEAGNKLSFVLDKELDVTAKSSKYSSVNVVNATSGAQEVDIQAGELTIYAMDVENDTFKQDTKDVVFGELKVVNTSGKSLELDKFEIVAKTTVSGATQVLSDVEFVINGTSQLLDAPEGTSATDKEVEYSENDLAVSIPQGTTIITLRANTEDDLANGEKVELALNASNLIIKELGDDVEVTDITPNTLSWNSVEYKNPTAVVSGVPLADVKVVKGATDLVTLQFEVEAGDSSDITLDKLQVAFDASGSVATKNHISVATLYKGSVSEANRLDSVSASKLASGVATFDGFEVVIDSDTTETFVVTVNTVDSDTVEGIVLSAKLVQNSLELEDSERDVVVETPVDTDIDSGKTIEVLGVGTLTLSEDTNNEDNKNAKTILAGEEAVVFSVDAIAKNEDVKVEKVVFTLSGTTQYKELLAGAKLYLDDTVVATASASDVANTNANEGTVTFKNISKLVFPTESAELRLALDTQSIGFEKVGTGASQLFVTDVAIDDAEGADSGEDLAAFNKAVTSAEFAVAPATVVVSVVESLSTGTAKVKVTVNSGDNTKADSAEKANVVIATMPIVNLANGNAFTVYNTDNVSNTGATLGALNAADRTVSGNSSETFVFVPQTTTDGTTYTSKIAKDGLTYTIEGVTYTISMDSEVDLGTKSY